jgi:hypothetical protein
MKVTCFANTGQVLTPRSLPLGNTPETVFPVRIGKEYQVFALSVYKGAFLVLLSDEDNLPNWFPIDLFACSDPRLPSHWFCRVFPDSYDGLQILIGYERLVTDELHYDGLLEREPGSLRSFAEQIERAKTQA